MAGESLAGCLERYRPRRQFRRRETSRRVADAALAQCVLLEYGQSLPRSGRAGADEGGEAAQEEEEEEALRGALEGVEGSTEFLSGRRIGALVGMQVRPTSSHPFSVRSFLRPSLSPFLLPLHSLTLSLHYFFVLV